MLFQYIMIAEQTVVAGLYCRLSRDDNNGHLVSMSIENQVKMLTEYAAENAWDVYDVYIDDGFSGTNFERPNFQRMLKDAERGCINCIVTKDLSRLGRNYVQTGYYTDEYFPEIGLRFIAVNDGIDTKEDDNDIAAFHNVLNELYPKQVSKKVRQVKAARAREGKFIGSQAPFGYIKSPFDKYKLIVDEEAAKLVRRMFREFASGDSGRAIADRLNREGVDSPRFYHYAKLGKVNPLASEKNVWGSGTVLQLLRNPVYLGHMAQGKRTVISYKTKKRRLVDQEDWFVVEGTHEAIIDRMLWDRVHERLSKKRHVRKTKATTVSLFSGTLTCSDCKSPLAYCGDKGVYRCSRYSNYGRQACTSHSIKEDALVDFVLGDIRAHAKTVVAERDELAERLLLSVKANRDAERRTLEVKRKEIAHQLQVSTVNLKNLYADHCSGKLPQQVFFGLANEFAKEQHDLEQKIASLDDRLRRTGNTEREVSEWMQQIERQLNIQALDRTTVTGLIKCIEVSEAVKENGKRIQNITIDYRFTEGILQNAKKDSAHF